MALIGGFTYLFLGSNGKQLCFSAQREQMGSVCLIDPYLQGRTLEGAIDLAPSAEPTRNETGLVVSDQLPAASRPVPRSAPPCD